MLQKSIFRAPNLNCYNFGSENVTNFLIKGCERLKGLVNHCTLTLDGSVTKFNVWAIDWRVVKVKQNSQLGLNASYSDNRHFRDDTAISGI